MVFDVHTAPRYAEFFCGGGMVRAALNDQWNCVLANDIDPMKAEVYAQNWGHDSLILDDVASIDPALLRQPIDMYWASSPCQDFSLAGKGLGLSGERSSAFRSWISAVTPAVQSGFAPRIIAFENVTGLISRSDGRDFSEVLNAIIDLGYDVGVLEINAKDYVPQSRPRLFVIGIHKSVDASQLCTSKPTEPYHSKRIVKFFQNSRRTITDSWLWLNIPKSDRPVATLNQLIDLTPEAGWFLPARVNELLNMMSPTTVSKIDTKRRTGSIEIGTLYKRGRPDRNGSIRQRAEVRFDGIAGCLRTPGGGSSRQTIIVVKGNTTKARLLSAREAIRLMGLTDSFIIPEKYNSAYKVAGDGVVVPVVKHLDETLFQPALRLPLRQSKVA